MVFSSTFTGGSAGGLAAWTGGVSGTFWTGGATGGATGTASTGAGTTVAAAGLTRAPQDSQNFAFGISIAPHCGQADKASIFAPQDSQNFIPGVTGLPHFLQVWEFAIINIQLTDLAR
jgi:hypothetical protein